MSSTKTTIRLTVPPTTPLPGPPIYRAIAGGVVVLLVLSAFALDALERRPQPIQEAQPIVMRQVIYVIATPSPAPEPTAAPAVMAAPPTSEPPTAEVVYVPVEVPVYVEVAVPAPVYVEEAPAEEWRPPLVAPGPCADWHPPMAPIEGCP